jgi:hypothetical protein
VAAPVYLAAIAAWHLRAPCNAAQWETLVHYLEHAMFLSVGLLYLTSVFLLFLRAALREESGPLPRASEADCPGDAW